MCDPDHSYTWPRKSVVSVSTASVYSQFPPSLHSARRHQSIAYSRRTRSWCSSVFHQANLAAGFAHDTPPPPVPSLPHFVVQDVDQEAPVDNREGSLVTRSNTPSSGHPSVLPPLPTLSPYPSFSSQFQSWSQRRPSIRSARPRGPRGPLLSYTQLYGDRQDIPSAEGSDSSCSGEQNGGLADGRGDIPPPYEVRK